MDSMRYAEAVSLFHCGYAGSNKEPRAPSARALRAGRRNRSFTKWFAGAPFVIFAALGSMEASGDPLSLLAARDTFTQEPMERIVGDDEPSLQFQVRCRRWKPGDLRLGLKEAWCGRAASPRGVEFVGFVRSQKDGWLYGPHKKQNVSHGGVNGEQALPPNKAGIDPKVRCPCASNWRAGKSAFSCARSPDGKSAVESQGEKIVASIIRDLPGNRGTHQPVCWETTRPATLSTRDAQCAVSTLPTIRQVLCFLEDSLGQVPVEEVNGRFCFDRFDFVNNGTSWRRCVLDAPLGGVRIQWTTSDDFGLSELRELFEAPFFSPDETAKLFDWLNVWGWHEAPFRRGVIWMGVLRGPAALYVELFWRKKPPARK